MAANLADHSEITVYENISGNTDLTAVIAEKAGQVFLRGVPVMTTAAGFVQEWDATVGAAASGVGIAGIALQPGANLASDGAGAPPLPFGSIGAPGTSTTFGKVPYEASAVNIPRGAPFSDGRHIFSAAVEDTVFLGQVDNSAGAVAADWTPVQADINKEFGLTKDATGHWYVDRGKVTVGTNTVLIVLGLDPNTGAIPNGNVFFRFKASIRQIAH
jgi:hypothetical protein